MNNYARIVGGVVVGIQQSPGEVVAPDLVPVAEYDPALLGATWDGVKFGPKGPQRSAPVPLADWLESLTPEEFAAVEVSRSQDNRTAKFFKVAELRGAVDPESAETVAVMAALETGGAIATDKKADKVKSKGGE